MLQLFVSIAIFCGINAQLIQQPGQFGGQQFGQPGQFGQQGFPNQFGQQGLGFQNPGQLGFPGQIPGQLGAGQLGFNNVNTLQNQQFIQQNVGNPNSCHVRGCGVGQQCVYRSNFGIPYICPTWIPVLPCQCQPGCKAQNQFIQVGQTKQIDTCGNRCTCNTQNGQASCTQIACNQASPGTQPQTIGGVPGALPGQFPGQIPGQFPGQIPGQFPGQIQGGQFPGQIPGQIPGQVPGGVAVGKKKK